MLTTGEVADILGVEEAVVYTIAHKLGIKHRFTYQGSVKISWWESADVDVMAKATDKAKAAAKKEMELEKLRKKHPLVKDERCFNLMWFPDPLPECFKKEDEEVDRID